MPRPLQPSDPIDMPEELRWHRVRVPACVNNGPFMLAGPAWGGECHHPLKRTIPCYKLLKGCTLDCPFCRWKRQYQSFIPLFNPREKKDHHICIIGGKKTWQDVQTLRVGDWVSINKGNHARDTIRLRLWTFDVDVLLTKVWGSRVVTDITPYLLHLWQRRELTEHFGHKFHPSLNTLACSSSGPDLSAEDAKAIPE